MNPTQLPTYPTNLPDDVEVRDFDLGGGVYARVRMEIRTETQETIPHYVLYAKAFQMDAAGNFVQAPHGNPSASETTRHSIPASAMGRTVEMDDAWVQFSGNYAPAHMMSDQPEGVSIPGTATTPEGASFPVTEVDTLPTTPATYGTVVWVRDVQKLYRYMEGFADSTARAKVEDLQTTLRTSDVRAGVGFRNRRNRIQE